MASVTASRRLQVATRLYERHSRQPPRPFGFGTRDRPCSLACVPLGRHELRCGMNDLLLISDELRRLSQSDREIVLPYDAALRATGELERAGVAVIGWEGWLILPDHRRTHSQFQGTTEIVREPTETWPSYVARCAETCGRMRQTWSAFPASSEAAIGQLLFCLSIAAAEPRGAASLSHLEKRRTFFLSERDYVGVDTHERRVYLTFCDSFHQLALLRPPRVPFVLFVGGDSSSESSEMLFTVAQSVLQNGAVYVLCWGAGASRLKDVVDEAFVARTIGDVVPTVMTTSHETESLDEALTFATTNAEPVAVYATACTVSVFVLVDDINLYNEA
jgi:hypothetical protein